MQTAFFVFSCKNKTMPLFKKLKQGLIHKVFYVAARLCRRPYCSNGSHLVVQQYLRILICFLSACKMMAAAVNMPTIFFLYQTFVPLRLC
ncbi:hypothetical protein D0T90_06695 [Neisseria animalis]|uniref:Uncharacterized protein n=1 Tax=Neisseria animalis TaxID=492 RepID=A0A5P3MRI4_NEIAN|nr:hypothetical protein D0T90_06695 [Neisseria animalis]